MTNKLSTRHVLALLSVLTVGLASGKAQVAPTDRPAPPSATAPMKNPAPTTLGEEEMIVLSPFVVSASEGEDSYTATTTLAGARVRTDLKDIGSAITVFTKKFMEDIGATSNLSLLNFTTNTEVGGGGGNFSGLGNGGALDETSRLANPNANTRVRGLDAADTTRDYFLSSIPWDSYNIDRVELQRGANSILFGVGSPAGIINTSMAIASFKDSAKYEFRFGSYDSVRNVLDINRVLLRKELAIRVIALDDNRKFQQEPAFNHAQRVYGALRYEPRFLDTETAHTSISINFENGKVKSNNPRILPPVDAITPWFTSLNKLAVNPGIAGLAGGVANSASAALNPWIYNTFRGIGYNQSPAFTYNYDTSQPLSAGQLTRVATYNGISRTGAIDGNIGGLPYFRPVGIANYNLYASSTNLAPIANTWSDILPGGSKGLYKDKSLTDPSIYDFYNNLMDGPNKKEWQDWNAFNVTVVQTFFDNRVAIQAAVDKQEYASGIQTLVNGGMFRLSVDINTVNPDGSANANFGRPYIGAAGFTSGSSSGTNDRTAKHLTVMGELRGSDLFGKTKLADILGRQVVTALVSDDVVKTQSRSWYPFVMGPEYSQAIGTAANPAQLISAGDRQADWLAYLGPSLNSATTAAGAHINPLQVSIMPQTTGIRYFDTHWAKATTPGDPNYVDPAAAYVYTLPGTTNAVTSTQSENPANYVGWRTQSFPVLSVANGDINQLYSGGSKQQTAITSKSANWQGYWLKDLLVTTFGYRKDTVKLAAATAPKDPISGVAFVDGYKTGDYQFSNSGISRATSVVLHTPRSIVEKLPGRTALSLLYNDSNNTSAVATRIDIVGNPLPSPTGHTRDYGFVLSTLDRRLALRVNWYKTDVKNATLTGALGNAGYTLAGVYMYGAAGAAVAKMGLAGLAPANAAVWDWSANDNGTPSGAARPFTPAQDPTGRGAITDAQELAAANSMIDQLPSQAFMTGYFNKLINVAAIKAGDWDNAFVGYNPYTQATNSMTYAYGGSFSGVSPVGTVDTESKGVEFELSGQPLDGWNVSLNASHTQATRRNLGATLTEFVTKTKEVMDSDAGSIRQYFRSGPPIRTSFYQYVWYPYQFTLAQEGSAASEIVPWRFNLVSSYYIKRGALKGVNVGLGYRWQQSQILGYGISQDSLGQWNLDVKKPLRGSSQENYDAWVGYTRKLTKKIGYRVQLNLSNIGQSAHLVPITVQPDGSPGSFRIQDGMSWQVSNTFTF